LLEAWVSDIDRNETDAEIVAQRAPSRSGV
jgi:hypothetical protein